MHAAQEEKGRKMITCNTCKKFATITRVTVNGMGAVGTVWGSCKHCGYTDKPDMVEFDDWDELGIDESEI